MTNREKNIARGFLILGIILGGALCLSVLAAVTVFVAGAPR